MIIIKNKAAIRKMEDAGKILSGIFSVIQGLVKPGVSTASLDQEIDRLLDVHGLVSRSKGYMGYVHASCISPNDVVVHGVPSEKSVLRDGDIVTIDICASRKGYCADMARTYLVGSGVSEEATRLKRAAELALDAGIAKALPGNRLTDISAAIQEEVERHGFSIVRDFAGHGIGKSMHEEPEVLNYGEPGQGPKLLPGMTIALEPMITAGEYAVMVDDQDGWTVRTKDSSLAAHVEDTIAVTEQGPKILTRMETV